MTNPKAKTAEEIARDFQTSLNSYIEYPPDIQEALILVLDSYADSVAERVAEERVKNATEKLIDGYNETKTVKDAVAKAVTETVLEMMTSGTKIISETIAADVERLKKESAAEGFRAGYRDGQERMRERAANIIEGDVLLTPDEFDPRTKIKVFELLNRLGITIRSLEVEEK